MSGRYALYEVLGLPAQSATEDVKKAYRKLAQKHHPDKAEGGDKDGETFKRLCNAYQILSDPIKKEEYDRLGDGFDDMTELWDDDDLGEMAIPSFMFTAAPFITPFHPFSIFVQRVSDPLKAFAELRYDDRRGEDKRQIQGYLGSISDVEATPEDRVTALKGLLEMCAKGSSNFVIESVLDDEDALPTIIEDIQNEEEDETIKFLSTELLHVVATANYVDVYQTGGLPAVLSVLKTENTKVLHSALLSLQHITQLGSACAECYKCNVVQYCVHLMHKRSIDVLLTASHILHNLLVEHADPHAALNDCRKLTSERYFCEIIRVVDEQHEKLEPASKIGKAKKKEAKASNSLSLQSQKVLTSVLAILAGSDESCHITLQEEDIKRLVDMLSYKNVRDVVINACTIIQALLHNKKIRLDPSSKLAEALVEQTLVLTKTDPSPTAAVILLTQLIHQRMLKSDDIIKRDVGRLLVTHLKSKNEETSVAAARGITYLCSPSIVDGPDFKGTSKLHKSVAPFLEPIVRQLLSVVKGTLEGTELRPASVMCAGLAAVAQHEAGRKAMMKQPVLESLCSLMAKSSADQVEKEAASLAILNLSKVGKAIDPVNNSAHKDALKQLSTQLHSKNHHIQACIITAFLTLAKDGVKPDCIYGKNLEQLKTTRVNSKVARELYQVLTKSDSEKPEEQGDELDPSAATKHKGTPAKKKKNAAAPDTSSKRRNGSSTQEVNGQFDSNSETSDQSESEDGGGGNNMFAALVGKKKTKKEKDPPTSKKKKKEEEARKKELEREQQREEKKKKKAEQKQREKEQQQQLQKEKEQQKQKQLKEQQREQAKQEKQEKQEAEQKKKAPPATSPPKATETQAQQGQEEKNKKKREKAKSKREEEEVRRGPPTTQAPIAKGQRREKHEVPKKVDMAHTHNDFDKKKAGKQNGPNSGSGGGAGQGHGSTWAQRLSPTKTVAGQPATTTAPATTPLPSSNPPRTTPATSTTLQRHPPASVSTTPVPTPIPVAPAVPEAPAGPVPTAAFLEAAPTPLKPNPAVNRPPPPLKRVNPPPGLAEGFKQPPIAARNTQNMAPGGQQVLVLQETNEGSGIQIESLVKKLNSAGGETHALLESDFGRLGVVGQDKGDKDKVVSPLSKNDSSLLSNWGPFSSTAQEGQSMAPGSGSGTSGPIGSGARSQAQPQASFSSQPPDLVQMTSTDQNQANQPIGGMSHGWAQVANPTVGAHKDRQWSQQRSLKDTFSSPSLFSGMSDMLTATQGDQQQRQQPRQSPLLQGFYQNPNDMGRDKGQTAQGYHHWQPGAVVPNQNQNQNQPFFPPSNTPSPPPVAAKHVDLFSELFVAPAAPPPQPPPQPNTLDSLFS
eukprot:TRINITY_DN756_c0_g2_i1.p1 TRINITY_DN756_c0_g2~~TRINITY_DN756_c0_g2_i1.p1  ORF type:complete len:1355 (+),score=414.63 TRINITY_DN756_c0_g2_i1:85-4149(+)